MPGACGIACEVCGFLAKGICLTGDGCVAGTDAKAPEKAEKFKAGFGNPCLILECAINKKVDYCFRCDEFPCEIHYQHAIFSKNLLDMIKGVKEKMQGT